VKKILYISPRNPFSGRYSGDVIRSKKFIEHLKKKNYITVISTEKTYSKKKFGNLNLINFKEENFIYKIIYIIFSILKLRPLQLGYFFSNKINNYTIKNYKNFDYIFCQSVRAAPYVLNLKIKKILDMGDLYSSNYNQVNKIKSILNPVKFIYFIESLLIKKFEKLCLQNFDKILLFSKKEINSLKIKKNKIKQINFGIDKIKNKFKYNLKNNKIIFIGNIKYLPNKIACQNFISKILPAIIQIHKDIEFHIIGEISKIDELIWKKNKSVKIHGKVKRLDTVISKVFCGLANLNVSSGIQTKLLTYMSYGIPSISSKQVLSNFDAIGSTSLPTYENKDEFINLILKLKNNKRFSHLVSAKSLKIIKRFLWNKVLKDIEKI
jgi:hypothetical protein